MGKKSVKIKLDTASQEMLKKTGYRMCFAKKVNDTYNVIWESYEQYLTNTTLSWTPQFEVFGTNTYDTSIKVEADTNLIPVELGQKCILNQSGVMGNAVTGDNKMGITIVNDFGPIHSGISQLCGIGDEKHYAPIYVSQEQRVKGNILLTPIEKVLIWFQTDVETGTIFEEARSNSIEVDLTNIDSRTISYNSKNGTWTLEA